MTKQQFIERYAKHPDLPESAFVSDLERVIEGENDRQPIKIESFHCCLMFAGTEYDNTFRLIVGHHPNCPKIAEFIDRHSLRLRIDSVFEKANKQIQQLQTENAKLQAENLELKQKIEQQEEIIRFLARDKEIF